MPLSDLWHGLTRLTNGQRHAGPWVGQSPGYWGHTEVPPPRFDRPALR